MNLSMHATCEAHPEINVTVTSLSESCSCNRDAPFEDEIDVKV